MRSVPDSNLLQKLGSGLSSLVSLPLGFFQSRPDVRTWGEADVVDPSIQPRTGHAASTSSLPNYPAGAFAYFSQTPREGKPTFVPLFVNLGVNTNKFFGPSLGVRNCNVQFPPLPPTTIGTPGYNFTDLATYQMMYLPYIVSLVKEVNGVSGFMCRASWRMHYLNCGYVHRMQ